MSILGAPFFQPLGRRIGAPGLPATAAIRSRPGRYAGDRYQQDAEQQKSGRFPGGEGLTRREEKPFLPGEQAKQGQHQQQCPADRLPDTPSPTRKRPRQHTRQRAQKRKPPERFIQAVQDEQIQPTPRRARGDRLPHRRKSPAYTGQAAAQQHTTCSGEGHGQPHQAGGPPQRRCKQHGPARTPKPANRLPAQAKQQAMANSYMLSADNAHAAHPNFPQKADPCAPVHMGEGVVLKYNASQKYTTNAVSGAIFKEICRKAGVPVQVFTNRADEPGGSTLGNLQSHTLPIPMADIGLAQLAMHSAVETAAVADADHMINAVAEFYRVHLRALGDGTYTLE